MTDLPDVGQPDAANTLGTAINRFRVMAITTRGNYTGVHPACLNLYMYGEESGDGSPHVVPKIQGMINASVDQIARNIPSICLKVSGNGGGPQSANTEGQPVVIGSDAICEYYQSAVDTVIKRSDFKKFYRKMALNGKIFGWQDAIADENHELHRIDLRVFPPSQWYKPSDVEEIEDMTFFGVDIPVDAQWAKAKYPALAAKIDEVAVRSVQMAPSASGYSDVYMGQTYAYPIVTLAVFFIRNRTAAMTDQEAMAMGLVESRPVPQTAPPANPDPTGPVDPNVPITPPAMREALFHTGTGEEVTSTHPSWPTKYVISKSIQIAGVVVSDEIWDGIDFPVLTNINIRVPLTPFGQSDCIRVRTQQADINGINSAMVKHAQWWKGPISLWPESVWELLPENFRNIGLKPNTNYKLPDDVLKRLLDMYGQRNIIGQFDPPPLPPHLMELQNYLNATFDSVGNRPDVSQGNAPTASSSGELAKVLLDAASQQNDFASFGLEDMAERFGRLVLDYIDRRWVAADFMRFDKTYDEATVNYIIAAKKLLEFTIEVDSSSMRQQRDAQVRADFAAGLIDQETALDLLQYDSPLIMQRIQAQQMAQAAVAGAGSESTQLQGSKGNGQQPASQGSFKLAGT